MLSKKNHDPIPTLSSHLFLHQALPLAGGAGVGVDVYRFVDETGECVGVALHGGLDYRVDRNIS